MGDTGVVRFAGNLDPTAQEFKPQQNFTPQMPFFCPAPPLLAPPHQLFYSYAPPQTLPYNDVAVLAYHQQYVTPPVAPYVRTVPNLPAESAAPTRAIVLSAVPSDVSETLVRRELEVFGEVRGVQMERVCEGVVTVHFYDLRHAETALIEIREQHMQHQTRLKNLFASSSSSSPQITGLENDNQLLALPPSHQAARGLIAGCAVWAQFVIPPFSAVPDGHNQGTIVIFNLDPTISTSCLREIFQTYGAVKELRETPLKKQQRFVEFYDVRDAAMALREMNGKEIQGKQVLIEFSRPGGGHGRRFLNAGGASIKSINSNSMSNHHQVKVSKSSPLPLPPPLPACRFSSSLTNSNNISLSAGAKKVLNCSKGNPNESSSIEANVGCVSLSGSALGNEEKAAVGAPKRISKSKSLISNQSSSSSTGIPSSNKQMQGRSRPWKGKQTKKLDTRFLINEDAMVESNCCIDSRTTVMIKNIPNKYSQKLLLNMLDNHCIHCNEPISGNGNDQPFSSYDFVYLPIDFNNKCNVGYGFVNMTSPQATWRLYKAFHHQHWEVFNSRKICEVTYARVQGLEALKEHFKNSKFPCEMDHYLPVVFSPPRDGRNLTEPLPIVGHKQHQQQQQQQQQPIILSLPSIKLTDGHYEMDDEDALKNNDNINDSTDDQEEEEDNLNNLMISSCSLSQNGGDIGDDDDDDDRDSNGGSIVA